MRSRSLQNEVREGSPTRISSEAAPGGAYARFLTIFASILEVKIDQKSIKNNIDFLIEFWRAFLMGFELILSCFLELFWNKMATDIEKTIL